MAELLLCCCQYSALAEVGVFRGREAGAGFPVVLCSREVHTNVCQLAEESSRLYCMALSVLLGWVGSCCEQEAGASGTPSSPACMASLELSALRLR
jgi:hypothetical protein